LLGFSLVFSLGEMAFRYKYIAPVLGKRIEHMGVRIKSKLH